MAESARFCNECGAPATTLCACGAANPATAKYCSECGIELRAAPAARASPPSPAAASATPAERRPLTVMFCDLVSSTELSVRLDPEDLSALLKAYQGRVAETIVRFDGFIAKYMGDGVLVYFGWPRAGEADAEQAVRAALAIVETVSAAPIKGEALRVRIGIATGLTIVGEVRLGQPLRVCGTRRRASPMSRRPVGRSRMVWCADFSAPGLASTAARTRAGVTSGVWPWLVWGSGS